MNTKSLFSPFQPCSAIATTPTAVKTLQSICQSTNATLWVPKHLKNHNTRVYDRSLKEHLAELWQYNRAFIFCLAVGAVVRLIAPLLKDKSTDPAVVVLDPEGQFVISLCGGHLGGADQLAQLIARQLPAQARQRRSRGAIPVITGAANSVALPGVDVLGVPFGWQRGEGDWNEVAAVIARSDSEGTAKGVPVEVIQEAGTTLWQKHLPPKHPFSFLPRFPAGEGLQLGRGAFTPTKHSSARIYISEYKHSSRLCNFARVQWHPRVLWLGIGCERGTSRHLIEKAITLVCQRSNLAIEAIAGVGTIDIKADEEGIIELCHSYHFPLKTFSAEELSQVQVPTPSPIVNKEVGTPSVAEAAALLAALGESLLVPKQIIKLEGEGAVTVAIARSEKEYTGKEGKLYLVGMGPGSLDQMTPAAQTAVTAADAVIGYSLYIDLIAPLKRPGQIIESLPITQERERAQRAIALAEWGLTVAVVSSGDCGIYAMAALVFSELEYRNWDGKTPSVEIFPGISALQAAAGRVGAPLMHDFCAISLSDLLTPWEVIEKRLKAAAVGDFIVAIYNPRSRKRTKQIIAAREILLPYRDKNTPVALVRSAYREEEQITITTLEQMLQFPIDMLTTVLIGNSTTRHYGDWMITPRGYNSYQ